MTNTWDSAMTLALAEANQSGQDVPVGAVLVDPDGNVVSLHTTSARQRATQPLTPRSWLFKELAKPLRSGAWMS